MPHSTLNVNAPWCAATRDSSEEVEPSLSGEMTVSVSSSPEAATRSTAVARLPGRIEVVDIASLSSGTARR